MKNDNYHNNSPEEYFKFIIDLTLLSFEKCLYTIIWKLYKKEWFPLINIFKNIINNVYWKGLNIPEVFRQPDDEIITHDIILNSNHLIWFVMIWRMNASIVIENELFGYYYTNSTTSLLCDEKLFKPLPKLKNFYSKKPTKPPVSNCNFSGIEDQETMEYLRYNFLLFRDSHLLLLTSMFTKNIYNDITIIFNGMFRNNYPSCFNILCVEELPDMSALLPLMNLYYDTGTKREASEDLIDAIRHIFMVKPMNQICLVRNIAKMLKHYYLKYPVVLELFKLVTKCVILGNLPYAKNPLHLQARIYTYLMYDENESKFFKGEELMNDLILNWTKRCKYFSLFVLREFLFYTCEISGIVDQILSRNFKWKNFKTFSRYGNGDVRKELSSQCSTPGFTHIDWDKIEKRTKNKIEKKTGIIVGVHTKTLEFALKLNKGDFSTILSKKMRAIESSLDLTKLFYLFTDDKYKYQTSIFPETSPLFHLKKTKKKIINSDDKKFCLNFDQFHFLCWCVAKRKRPILETKWLYLLNMSDKGIKTVKDWLFSYYDFSIPDNSFKEYAVLLYNSNPLDYLILKSYIKLVEFYKNDHIFHLPLQDSIHQFNAIRSTLRLEPWETTPSRAGFGLLCRGCGRWANKITESYDRLSSKKKNNQTKQKKIKELDEKSFLPKRSNLKKNKGKSNRNGYATYLSTSLLDPLSDSDNCLYCKRAVFKREYDFVDKSKYDFENNDIFKQKKDLTSLFKGFYQNNNNQDVSSEEIPILFENNYENDSSENDILNGGDDDDNKKMDNDENMNDIIDEDMLLGFNDVKMITDNPQKFENIKIPNIIISHNDGEDKNDISIYEYTIINKPIIKINQKKKPPNQQQQSQNDNEYDELGYPIEKIILRNKLLKDKDSFHTDKNYNINKNEPIYHQLIGNTFNIHENQENANLYSNISITSIILHIISQKYNCYNKLEYIDLVGIFYTFKNITYGLCCQCGCFIRVCNKNLLNRGVGCGRHFSESHRFDNPLAQLDRSVPHEIKTEYSHKTRCIAARKDEKWLALNNDKISKNHPFYQIIGKNMRLIHLFDYRDITSKYFNLPEAWCHFCKKAKSFVVVTIYNFVYKLIKIPLCKMHTKLCKSRYSKKSIIPYDDLELLMK